MRAPPAVAAMSGLLAALKIVGSFPSLHPLSAATRRRREDEDAVINAEAKYVVLEPSGKWKSVETLFHAYRARKLNFWAISRRFCGPFGIFEHPLGDRDFSKKFRKFWVL